VPFRPKARSPPRYNSFQFAGQRSRSLISRKPWRFDALDDHGFDLPGTGATERGGAIILNRGEAADASRECRELDHHEAMEMVRTFHDLKSPTPGEHLSAMTRHNVGDEIGIFLVVDRIDNP
jgi:hypothetical protein